MPPPNRTGERRLNPIGKDPATTVDEVFDAWARVHEVVRALVLTQPDPLVRAVEGDVKHLNLHATAIERLLQG